MFVLTKISDVIPLHPDSFTRPTEEALEEEINRKYSNKVLHNTGLCICLYDIESIGDGMVKPGDGKAFVKCVFRMIIFRPFVGEILVGWVSSCTEEGLNGKLNTLWNHILTQYITVKMDFFNDIHIPKSLLFEECTFIPREQAWRWEPEGSDALFIDTNEKIRFRVESEIFTEQFPAKPGEENVESNNQRSPYTIIGSCQMPGTGVLGWWREEEEQEE